MLPQAFSSAIKGCGGNYPGFIIAGCESQGASGYVVAVMGNEQAPEFMEVVEEGEGPYLVLVCSGEGSVPEITAVNNDGDEVVVRKERYLKWADTIPGEGWYYLTYSELPRIRFEFDGMTEDNPVVNANLGQYWSGEMFFQRVGEKVHVWGSATYNTGGAHGVVQIPPVFYVPGNFNPMGEVLIPIVYGNKRTYATLAKQSSRTGGVSGYAIRFDWSSEYGPQNGETVEIDSYYVL